MLRIALIAALLGVGLSKQRYDNYKVYEINGRTDAEIHAINGLDEDQYMLDVWQGAGRQLPAHINVPPQHQAHFVNKLHQLGLNFSVYLQNVQDQIDAVELAAAKIPKSARDITQVFYDFDENVAFLDQLRAQFSDRMQRVDFGTTLEGRPLFYIKLSSERFSSSKPEDSTKPVIWVESTTHAREWITNACILNFIEWMMVEYGRNSDAIFLLNTYDWFIVPVHNPDGFAWSHSNDRLWRKTRSSGWCSPGSGRGNGVDPNRNWGYQWGGGQTNQCQADYQGPSAFAVPSTKEMAHQMSLTPPHLRKAFLSLHSYSQLILLPFAYNRAVTAPNPENHLRVANAAREAILRNSGTDFTVGKPGDLLYNAPGGAYDYAIGALDYEIGLTYELHPKGSPGFILEGKDILPCFSDFLASIIAIGKELDQLETKK